MLFKFSILFRLFFVLATSGDLDGVDTHFIQLLDLVQVDRVNHVVHVIKVICNIHKTNMYSKLF